ncbi:MAG: helix-turn-helix domain-containing protein [Bacteroidales bacterium]|nr:helix-turn-helix domain-containing protein [Bacteroidales bacterium]
MLDLRTYKPEKFPDLIERIWIAENKEEAIHLLVPPNQYVNVIIPLNNSTYSHNEKWIQTPQIEGLTLQSTYLQYTENTKLIGIRFYPHGLQSFVNVTGKQIINSSIDLQSFLNDNAILSAEMHSNNNDDILSYIYSLLTELFNKKNYEQSKIIRDYYQYFRGDNSMISIEEYCKQNHTNYTSLNRFFTKIIGISPKRFERLIKFRKSLCSIIDSDDSLTNIGVDSGYFDQAHFIREFKMFLNSTPSAYQSLIKTADRESKIINYNFRLF